jgi:hypothetical protein
VRSDSGDVSAARVPDASSRAVRSTVRRNLALIGLVVQIWRVRSQPARWPGLRLAASIGNSYAVAEPVRHCPARAGGVPSTA